LLHTYLINLDRSSERLKTMAGRLKRLGIAYQRVPAVDGRTLPPLPGSRLSPAERGCLLSHRDIWQMIAERGDPWSLILEDDALLSPALPSFVADGAWIPQDADLIKLDTTAKPVFVDDTATAVRGASSIVVLRSPHMGSAAYLISARAAKALLARSLEQPVDRVLFELPRSEAMPGVTYQADPALCRQDGQRISAIAADRKKLRRQKGHILHRQYSKATTYLRRQFNGAKVLLSRHAVRKAIPFAGL
jgi:glycosyl transferase family 25